MEAPRHPVIAREDAATAPAPLSGDEVRGLPPALPGTIEMPSVAACCLKPFDGAFGCSGFVCLPCTPEGLRQVAPRSD